MFDLSNSAKESTKPVGPSSSLEDYLEAILMLSATEGQGVRVTDISEWLSVSKSSVSVAVKKLVAGGLVSHERYGDIHLTEAGRTCAKEIAGRHDLLYRFLKEILGLDERTAQQDACRLEHDLSPKTAESLSRFVEFLTDGRPEDCKWKRLFNAYLEGVELHAVPAIGDCVKGCRRERLGSSGVGESR